jgi:hypothetical protein
VLVLNFHVPPLELYYSATEKKKGIIKGRKECNTGKLQRGELNRKRDKCPQTLTGIARAVSKTITVEILKYSISYSP